jgi:EpsI family protein
MRWLRALTVAGLLVLIAAAGVLLRPSINAVAQAPQLNDVVPVAFGDWRLLPNPLLQASVSTNGATSTDQPYDDLVSRSYVNGRGEVVMLALAYGKNQRQEIKVHRPELCYPAQGYKVLALSEARFQGVHSASTGADVTGKRMVVSGQGFNEVVSYWIRIGDTYSSSPWRIRWQIMREGLQGRMTDGILFRVSRRVTDGEAPGPHHQILETFARDLVMATPAQARVYLVR